MKIGNQNPPEPSRTLQNPPLSALLNHQSDRHFINLSGLWHVRYHTYRTEVKYILLVRYVECRKDCWLIMSCTFSGNICDQIYIRAVSVNVRKEKWSQPVVTGH